MRSDLPIMLLCVCLLSGHLVAQCAKGQDHRSSPTSGIQIVEMTLTGTHGLNSVDIAGIEGQMIGGCYNDDADEIQTRVRALFQDLGYLRVQVQTFHLTPLDPLKTPKPVRLEAEVSEGEHFRLEEISFTGNHHFGTEQLRKSFPLKQGDLVERRGISGGLEALRKLYTSEGYIDFFTIPNISFTGSGIHMNIEVNEGPQYHMGRLDVFAKKELADRFRAAWDLREGKIYDAGYPAKFVDEHHDILPTGFTASEI